MSYTPKLAICGSFMSLTLSIYLPVISEEIGESQCFWVAYGDEDSTYHGHGELNAEYLKWQEIAYSKTRVFIPGEQVYRTQKEVPTRSRKTAAQAIPFLLEQEIATDIEDVHVAFDFIEDRGSDVAISSMEKTLLENIIDALKNYGVDPDAVYPDTALIQKDEIIQIGERVLFAPDEALPIALTKDMYETIYGLNEISLKVDAEKRITNEQEDQNALDDQDLNSVDFLSRDFNQVNLRQGQYLKESDTEKSLALLIGLVSSLLVCLTFVVSYWGFMGWQFGQESEKARLDAENQYRSLFPNERRILDVRKQMLGHLQRSGGAQQGNNFIEMFNFATSRLNQQNSILLRQIRYQQETQSLQLELQATTLELVNQLTKQLSEHNQFASELISANSNSDGIVARIRISNQ